jgi:putative acetyltransferase
MILRPEDQGDRHAIFAVVAAAFPTFAEARLVDRLRADGDAKISFVASIDGVIVGHVMLSRMVADFRALGLGPVAVVPSRQRSGIGTSLIAAGVAAATGRWDMVFVLGDPAFYGRFGFDPALARRFGSPYAGPQFLALSLTRDSSAYSGSVDYAPAFDDLTASTHD